MNEEAMRVSKETWVLAALCAADLFSTLFLVHQFGAEEGNAVMSFYLKQGMWTFIAAKCLMFVPALLIGEWYRRRNPRLVASTLRSVIVLYVAFYTVGLIRVNRPVTAAELGWEKHPPQTSPTIVFPSALDRSGTRLPGM
jgi:hypothetical protein